MLIENVSYEFLLLLDNLRQIYCWESSHFYGQNFPLIFGRKNSTTFLKDFPMDFASWNLKHI